MYLIIRCRIYFGKLDFGRWIDYISNVIVILIIIFFLYIRKYVCMLFCIGS